MADPSLKSSIADNKTTFADYQALESGNSFKDRLLQAVTEKGWKSVDLARESGVPGKRISDYLKGPKVPSAEYLFPIADALGVSAEWLALGRIANRAGLGLLSVDDAEWVWVPRFDLREIRDEGKAPAVDTTPFRKDWLTSTLGTAAELWLAAMLTEYEPRGLAEGDLVFCREIEPVELLHGHLCFFRLGQGIIVGRYALRPDPSMVKAGDNLVAPEDIGTDEGKFIPIARILGKLGVQRF